MMTLKEKEIIKKYRGLSVEDREIVRELTAELRILLHENRDENKTMTGLNDEN